MVCKTHGGTCPTPLRCSGEAAEQAAIEKRFKARQYLFRRHCPECGRDFDLNNEIDNDEWHYGHDCEV